MRMRMAMPRALDALARRNYICILTPYSVVVSVVPHTYARTRRVIQRMRNELNGRKLLLSRDRSLWVTNYILKRYSRRALMAFLKRDSTYVRIGRDVDPD